MNEARLSASGAPLDGRLRSLMALRALMVTALLLIAAYVESISETLPRTNPLYSLIAATYALTLLYALALRFLPLGEWQVQVQLLGDLVVITGMVYVTGGSPTPAGFMLLYPISVLSGGALLSRRHGLLLAGVATILYGGLLALVHHGLLAPRGLAELRGLPLLPLLNSVLVVGVTCATAGLIGGWLSESLRRVGQELQDAAGEVADLRELNTVIVDNIRTGLLMVDAATRVEHGNDFGAALLGRTRAELVGRPLCDVFGSELFDAAPVAARAGRREAARFNFDYLHPDGRTRHMGLTVSAIETKKRTAPGFLLVFQDLTEIQRLEQQVRLKEKLAAVGEMAASLAHEIRNPLSSISGSAEVLLTEPGISGDQQRLLEIVKRESRRLSNTLNEFLVQVRPAGPRAPVDVAPLVQEALALLRNGSEVRPGHRIEYRAEGGPHLCLADPDQIVQVFWNLARNGLQAMPRGGLLSVRLSVAGDEVLLCVRDEGAGMAREDQARLFEPFHSKDGTGLGLAIVYRIVQRQRGDVAVRSAAGRGTEVEVRLPLASLPVQA